MANGINSSQTNNSTSTGASTGYVRDINASASLGEFLNPSDFFNPSNFLNNFGASTSSATSGNITIGDKIIGGQKSAKTQFSILKILTIAGIGLVAYKIYKGAN